MKNSLTNIIKVALLLTIFCSLNTAFGQAPQKMSYQAVVRNAANTLIANTAVGVKISVLQTSASGTVVYSERHTPTTNANGLATFEIGGGTVLSGTFASINWSNGPYFIKTETDPAGGTNYTIAGTSQLASVPYALFAANSGTPNNWTTTGNDIGNLNSGNVGIGVASSIPYKFTVESSGIGIAQQAGSAGPQIGFYTSGSAFLQTHNNFDLNFSTNNGTNQMTLQKGTGNLGLGNTGTLQNKLQIGTAPGFIGNDIAIGNGIQAMSLAQSPTASTFFTNTNFAFMPASGPANVGIGTTTPTAKLDVRGSIRVSENDTALGTVFKQIQTGSYSNGGSNFQTTSGIVTFPHPFVNLPIIIASPAHQTGAFNSDMFSITIGAVTTTGFTYYVRRLDDSSWAQNLKINWIAINY